MFVSKAKNYTNTCNESFTLTPNLHLSHNMLLVYFGKVFLLWYIRLPEKYIRSNTHNSMIYPKAVIHDVMTTQMKTQMEHYPRVPSESLSLPAFQSTIMTSNNTHLVCKFLYINAILPGFCIWIAFVQSWICQTYHIVRSCSWFHCSGVYT